jgi:hypothetical protein
MRKKIAIALTAGVAAATVGLGAGAVEARPAGAGDGGKPTGITCMQFGLGLRSLGAPAQGVAINRIPLSDLLALHRNRSGAWRTACSRASISSTRLPSTPPARLDPDLLKLTARPTSWGRAVSRPGT